MSDAKHTPEQTRAEARRICGLPNFHDRCAGIDGILRDVLDINKDLLAACETALVGLDQLCSADGTLGDKLRAAIRKAEGK